MTPPRRHSERARAFIAGSATVAALLSGCTSPSQEGPPPPKPLPSSATVADTLTPREIPAVLGVANTAILLASENSLSPLSASRVYAYTLLAAQTAHREAAAADREAAAAHAAASVGKALFAFHEPAQAEWDALTRKYPAPSEATRQQAEEIAQRVIAQAEDGYLKAIEPAPEVPPASIWDWRPTGNANTAFDTPNWGTLQTISDTEACTLPPPDRALLESQGRAMLEQYDPSAGASPVVLLWLAGAGSPTPAGYWVQMAAGAARSQGLDAAQTTALVAAVAIATYDAGILAWREKRRHFIARPETLWQEWTGEAPLLVRETPAHPSYPSGHATFSGAGAGVIEGMLGLVPLTLRLPADNGVYAETRTFDNPSVAAEEAAQTRVEAGFHYPEDGRAGIQLGRCAATAALAYLEAVP